MRQTTIAALLALASATGCASARGGPSPLSTPGPLAEVDCNVPRTCEGSFTARTQAELESVTGCTFVTGELEIESGPADFDGSVSDLRPLRCLERVAGRLHIQQNPRLRSLRGLEALREVGVLELEQNARLETLAGLEGLRVVQEGLYIHYLTEERRAPRLHDVSALKTAVVRGLVEIEDATALSECAVSDLLTSLGENGSRIDEVTTGGLAACAACSGAVCRE